MVRAHQQVINVADAVRAKHMEEAWQYDRRRAFIMTNALNEIDALLSFHLTRERLVEEIIRILGEKDELLRKHREDNRAA